MKRIITILLFIVTAKAFGQTYFATKVNGVPVGSDGDVAVSGSTPTLTYDANALKDSMVITYNGVRTAVKEQGFVLLGSASASSSSTIEFTIDTTIAWQRILIVGSSIVTATDVIGIWIRFGYGSTPTYASGGTDYNYSYVGAYGANYVDASYIQMCRNCDNNKAKMFTAELGKPSNSSLNKILIFNASCFDSGTTAANYTFNGSGAFNLNTRPISGIQILASSGNINSGEFSIYGLK